MRILYLLRNAEGGIRTHVEALMRGALERGHDVLLITDLRQADAGFQRTIEENPELRKRVVSIPMRSAPGPWDLLTLWLLMVGLKSARGTETEGASIATPGSGVHFDAVHGHGAKGGLFARLCRIFGILPRRTRVVYTPHGGSLHAMHGFLLNSIYVWIERRLAKYTDVVLAESRYTFEQFEKRVGSGRTELRLNRNGIAELEPNLSAWPAGLGKSIPARIGAFGLLRSIKCFDVLISAVFEVRKRGYSVQLDISGEGKERPNLEKLIRDLSLTDHVRLHRETSNAISEMKTCHIVAQPSRFESFGLVALEAQALGCAVVASGVGGLVDIVEDGQTGKLVGETEVDDLADAIVWFLDHPDETLTMRARAARRAREEFSVDRMVEGAIDSYRGKPAGELK